MSDDELEDQSPQPDEPAPKRSLTSVLYVMVNAFPFETEKLGIIQGRSLSGAMEKALTGRLDRREQDDFQASRTFMGCSSGIPDAPDRPVWNPLLPEQVAQLTDADVSAYAAEYLARVLKTLPGADPVAALAVHARAERNRIAEDLDKHGEVVRDSLRNIAATSSVMQNWKELHDSIQGSAANAQRAMKLAMGPAEDATNSLRQAIAQIHKQSFDFDQIFRSPAQRALEEMQGLDKSLRGPLEHIAEVVRAQDAALRSPLQELAESVRAQGELYRHALESPLQEAMKELGEQLSASNREAIDGLRSAVDDLDVPPLSRAPEIRNIDFPVFPRFEETAPGRTTLAVESLRAVSDRMEEKMDLIVDQADNVAGLIAGVTGTIQDQAKQLQSFSDAQTRKAMWYARWSLVIAALALAISAAFGVAGYLGDREDARSQAAHAAAMLEASRAQNEMLRDLLKKQLVPPPVATAPTLQRPTTPPLPLDAARGSPAKPPAPPARRSRPTAPPKP
jgi:hypothetical protein